MKNKLFTWQEECLEQWEANRYRGIINVVTGAGKTVLAMGAIEALSRIKDSKPLKIKIVVPKTFLMYQWQNALKENLNVSYEDIGFFSGAVKSQGPREIMIYVINSARYSLTRHIAEDLKNLNRILLIADECHHYGTEENSKIFDFLRFLPEDIPFYSLGLSATPHSKNYSDVLVPALGREIYRFTFFHALKADIISPFTVFNVCVNFDGDETAEYENLSEKLGLALFKLKRKCPSLYVKNGQAFFTGLEHIIKTSEDFESSELARTVLLLSIKRKEIVYLAKSRIQCVIDLVKLTRKTSKIIVFGERIEMAEEIYKRLYSLWPNEVGIYHSKLPKQIGKNALRQYENFEIRILVSCKTLDEGLNVTETDVGIVVSSTGSKRQRIQRLGRVLRKKRHDRPAYFYYLFVDNTSEEDEMLNEMTDRRLSGLVNVIDLRYDEEQGLFSNPDYEDLVFTVISYMSKNQHAHEEISEFLRNAYLGLLTSDWLLPQDTCLKRIEEALSKSERNYYIAMFLLIKARLG